MKKTRYREQFNLKDKIIFTYGGNMGAAQEMFNILYLAKRLLDEPRAHFLLVGDGSEFLRMKKYIEQEALHNITLLQGVSQEEFYGILSESDVGLIFLARDLTVQNIPGKFLSYLYAGLPTLASVNTGNDLQSMIFDNQVGFTAVSGEVTLLLNQAKILLTEPSQRKIFSDNARQLLDKLFSVKHAARTILQSLENIPPMFLR